ncbi:MAG: hypothetical protein AAGC49_04100 [Brevundimonas sp.]
MTDPDLAAARRVALRRSAAMLATTLAAIVGIVILVVSWVSVAKTTLLVTNDGTEPCLVAYGAKEGPLDGASVHYDWFPARSTCSWVVDGTREEVVVAEASGTTTALAAVLIVGGAAGTVGLVLAGRRRARR